MSDGKYDDQQCPGAGPDADGKSQSKGPLPGKFAGQLFRAGDMDVATVPIMLVSNYPNWQEKAVKAGGVPGFGKAQLGQPAMLEALRPFLG